MSFIHDIYSKGNNSVNHNEIISNNHDESISKCLKYIDSEQESQIQLTGIL